MNLRPYPKYKDSGIEWIGEIPDKWEIKKISWLFDIIGSGTTPKSMDDIYYYGDIGWVNSADLNDSEKVTPSNYITQQALTDYSTLKLYPKGSFVIALYGATIGKVGILNEESTVNQACLVLGKSKRVLINFLGACLEQS
ncbi:MAG: restriction endonuclease subunit S [Thermodesulfobacteriota bacterium]